MLTTQIVVVRTAKLRLRTASTTRTRASSCTPSSTWESDPTQLQSKISLIKKNIIIFNIFKIFIWCFLGCKLQSKISFIKKNL